LEVVLLLYVPFALHICHILTSNAVNLPVAVVPVTMILLFLPSKLGKSSDELKDLSLFETIKRFDPLGTILLLGTVISLLLALEWGGSRYSWSSGQVVAPLVVFAVTLVAWLVLQYFQVRTRWHAHPSVTR
jgi:hypothetical protein